MRWKLTWGNKGEEIHEVDTDKIPHELIAVLKNEEERENYRKSYRQADHVTDPIKRVLLQELEANLSITAHDYNDSDWSHKQADRLGYIRGLRKALRLIP